MPSYCNFKKPSHLATIWPMTFDMVHFIQFIGGTLCASFVILGLASVHKVILPIFQSFVFKLGILVA